MDHSSNSHTKIESVFHTLLSEWNVAFYGTVIIGDIAQEALNKEDLELELFLTNTYEGDIISEVLRRIIWSYGWLQGNVFVRKCNAKVGVQHHETIFLSLGTPSAIASTNTKKGGGGKKSNGGVEKSNSWDTEEENNPQWHLIKQQQNGRRRHGIGRSLSPFWIVIVVPLGFRNKLIRRV